jgi:hypothetical protein
MTVSVDGYLEIVIYVTHDVSSGCERSILDIKRPLRARLLRGVYPCVAPHLAPAWTRRLLRRCISPLRLRRRAVPKLHYYTAVPPERVSITICTSRTLAGAASLVAALPGFCPACSPIGVGGGESPPSTARGSPKRTAKDSTLYTGYQPK